MYFFTKLNSVLLKYIMKQYCHYFYSICFCFFNISRQCILKNRADFGGSEVGRPPEALRIEERKIHKILGCNLIASPTDIICMGAEKNIC